MSLDANDVLKRAGADALREALDASVPYLETHPENARRSGSTGIEAAAYEWRNPWELPRRPWMYGRLLMRGIVSVTVAPGGTGKSALAIAEAIAMTTGRTFLGECLPEGPVRVWYWNLEDPMDELHRRIQAAAMHHRVSRGDLADRLFVNSGILSPLLSADTRLPSYVDETVFRAIEEAITHHGIDVIVLDPFISSHALDENDNTQIDRLMKRWSRLATKCRCAVYIVHHTRKGDGETRSESARGAKAIVDAARMVRVLNRPKKDESDQLDEDSQDCAFWTCRDKQNMAGREADRQWYRIVSVSLDNGPDPDEVGVVEQFNPAARSEALEPETIAQIQETLANREYAFHYNSGDWAGYAIAQVLGLNAEDTRSRARLRSLIGALVADGYLVHAKGRHPARRTERPVVHVGQRRP